MSELTTTELRDRLNLILYSIDNQKPGTLHQQAHRETAKRLIRELLADILAEVEARRRDDEGER